ncbi:uncharacterized protein LOC128232382 [Mya arenaria]|uniref:uncharacterized protein LOC128232382 n=1 Tax=Mya arenaria TaxID=6604 RepID=UPI0022DFAF02|nr:uncharacterized protein LOC128232382 [Mya arenaria]
MIKEGILLSTVLLGCVQLVTSCSCYWRSAREMYCDADYVIMATIKSELSPPGQGEVNPGNLSLIDLFNRRVQYTYEIEIHHVFRQTASYSSAMKVIHTEGPPYCIRRFEPGSTFVIMDWVYTFYNHKVPMLGASPCGRAYNIADPDQVSDLEQLFEQDVDCSANTTNTVDTILN